MKKMIAALFLLFLSQQASALCLPTVCTCSVSATPVAFGAFNPLTGASHDATGNVAFACGGVAGLLIPYTITLSTGSSNNYPARRMVNGANFLTYNLYRDSTRQTIWGNGTGGSATVTGNLLLDLLGLSPPTNIPVYGRISPGQITAVPGIYADTITVTVTYF